MNNILEKIFDIRLLNGKVQYLSKGRVWKYLPYVFTEETSELTTDVADAILNADNPSSINPFVTNTYLVEYTKEVDQLLEDNQLDWSLAKHYTLNLEESIELFDVNLPNYPSIKEILLTVNPDSNSLTLPSYYRVISGPFDSGSSNFIRLTCVDNTAQAKVDTVTLTGTTGTADMTLIGGLTKTITFNEDLETTASDFVTAFAEDYLVEKIVVTSNGADIIFTAQYPGYNFVSPAVDNASDDLAGEVNNTVVNISPVVWCSISQVTG